MKLEWKFALRISQRCVVEIRSLSPINMSNLATKPLDFECTLLRRKTTTLRGRLASAGPVSTDES